MPSIRKLNALFVGLLGTVATLAVPSDAQAYDMDCKVILCIAGGFPSSCSDAYAYMISRITRFPNPLPPFGFCAMSDGSQYTAHDVNYARLRQGPETFYCPEDKKLFYRRNESDNGHVTESGFCYSHITTGYIGWGSDRERQTIYHNRSPAQRINFRLNIVIEPGTDSEYRSPQFHINYNTGFVAQTQW